MYGFRTRGSLYGLEDAIMEFNAAGTFAADDSVMFDGSTGEIVVGTTGSKLVGIALEAATEASEDVAVNATPFNTVIADNDNTGTTFAATHVGEYADLTGGTGAQVIDTSDFSTGVATFCALEYNPQGVGLDSDTSIGKFLLVESHFYNVAA